MLTLEVLMTRRLTRSVPVLGLLAAVVTLWPGEARAQYGATNGEWPTYAGDLGGTKYSALDQIDAANFSTLEIAWRWESADGALDLAPSASGTARSASATSRPPP